MSSTWFGLGKTDDRVRPLPPPPNRNKRLIAAGGHNLDFSSSSVGLSSSSARHLHPTPEDDVMSEVTVDTAILHPISGGSSDRSLQSRSRTRSRQSSSRSRQLEDALRQIAHLKVEVANRRAKEEEWEWKYSKLQDQSQEQERRILRLESDRSSLRKHLRQLETKLMKVSMAGATSSRTALREGDGDSQSVNSSSSKSPSMYTASSQKNRSTYRGSSDDGDDCYGDDEDDGTTSGASSAWHYDQKPASELEIEFPRSMGTLEEEEEVSDDGVMKSIEFGASSPTTSKSVATRTTVQFEEQTVYPEDDPFATMNPLPPGGYVDEDENEGQGAWWRFGGAGR